MCDGPEQCGVACSGKTGFSTEEALENWYQWCPEGGPEPGTPLERAPRWTGDRVSGELRQTLIRNQLCCVIFDVFPCSRLRSSVASDSNHLPDLNDK